MSDDTISRRAAIDAICKSCSMEGDYHKCDGYSETSIWCDELVALRALPSVQPKQRWIPVTERLPEDGTWNIFSDGETISVERYKMDAIDHFFPQGRWFSFDEAVAWIPLPEPYREGEIINGQ